MDVQVKRWTREECERLIQAGVLGEDDRVQLVAGELVQTGPQGAPHAAAINAVAEALRELFGGGSHIRIQEP
jgi:DNA mismatch repair protein MutH